MKHETRTQRNQNTIKIKTDLFWDKRLQQYKRQWFNEVSSRPKEKLFVSYYDLWIGQQSTASTEVHSHATRHLKDSRDSTYANHFKKKTQQQGTIN